VAGEIFHLPAILRAYFLPFDAAAREFPFLRAQFVHLRGDGKVLEVLNPAPPFAPLYPPQLLFRSRMGWKIGGVCRAPILVRDDRNRSYEAVALFRNSLNEPVFRIFLESLADHRNRGRQVRFRDAYLLPDCI
jgi:hypothetical protein